MAQRLLASTVPECKTPYDPKTDDLPSDFPWEKLDGKPLYQPVGCRTCRGVGYTGRMGIYELMTTNEQIRELANRRVSSWEIRRAASAAGMRTLRADAWDKCMIGSTSVDEVLRITKADVS